MSCVYQARNRINGKRYVGKTSKTMSERREEHEKSAGNGGVVCKCFHAALRKYGSDAFEWRVLMREDDPDELNDAERVCIRAYRTKAPNGYNLTDGGDGVIGLPLEVRKGIGEKMSKFWKGRKKTPEHLANISKALTGKTIPAETREKISRANSGKKLTEEHRAKIGIAGLGREVSEETREKKRRIMKGRPSKLRGRTYEDIYGDRAEEYKGLRSRKRNRRKRNSAYGFCLESI